LADFPEPIAGIAQVYDWKCADTPQTGVNYETHMIWVEGNNVSTGTFKLHCNTYSNSGSTTHDFTMATGSATISATSVTILHATHLEVCIDVDGTKYEFVRPEVTSSNNWTRYTAPVSDYSAYTTNPHNPYPLSNQPQYRISKLSGSPDEYHVWQKAARPDSAVPEWEHIGYISNANLAAGYSIYESGLGFLSTQSNGSDTNWGAAWSGPAFGALAGGGNWLFYTL
jgi:hypothetical protein